MLRVIVGWSGVVYRVISFGLLFCLFTCGGYSEKENVHTVKAHIESLSIPEEVQQLLLVTIPSWDEFRGTLRLCSRSGIEWRIENDPLPVVVGRNGLGWGIGLHTRDLSGPHKNEGDGRAPSGVFELGTAFGYSVQPPDGCIYPYLQATEFDYFIDDAQSRQYNQWVSLIDSTRQDPRFYWNSFERMRRDDDLYKLGIIVEHNMDPVQKGRGSAIFLHIWRGPDQPTAGCTAMSRENLQKVLRWLDPSKRPLLFQLPEESLTDNSLRMRRSSLYLQ